MQIKSSMRYHLIAVRKAIIKKSADNKCWGGYEKKGTLIHCWCKYKLVHPLWKTVYRLLKKLKIQLPYDPEIPLVIIFGKKPKQNKITNLKRRMHPHVHSSFIYDSQDMEETLVFSRRWINKKMLYTHTDTCMHAHTHGILLSCKKEWNNAICSNMDGLRDYRINWSKSDWERHILYAITHMWNLKS